MWSILREELSPPFQSRVQNELDSTWKQNMENKSMLNAYRKLEGTRGLTTGLYDELRRSRLLALATAGMLNTREQRHARDPFMDIQCARCGASNSWFWNAREENIPIRQFHTNLDFTPMQHRRL